MARPRKDNVDFFPHFVHHGKTMAILENRFGNDGYAAWFKILECLAAESGHFLDLRDPVAMEFLASKCRLSGVSVTEILDTVCFCGGIDRDLWEHHIVWSDALVQNLQSVYAKRQVSAPEKPRIPELPDRKLPETGVSVTESTQRKVEESKGKESNVEETIARKRAEPPPSKKNDSRSRSFEGSEDSSEPESSAKPNAPPGLDPNLAAPVLPTRPMLLHSQPNMRPIATLEAQAIAAPDAAARDPGNGGITREFLKTDSAVREWIKAVIDAWNAEAGLVGASMPRAHYPPNVNLELALFAWWQDEEFRNRYEDAIRKVAESQWVRTEKRGGVSLEWLARRQRYVDVLDGKYAEFVSSTQRPPKKQIVYKDL